MNRDEQEMIDGLFRRLAEAERTAPPRDAEADRFIQGSVARQPGAPYYMAQTIIVQEQALEAAQARIRELEAKGGRSQGSGGLLGSLFGGGANAQRTSGPMGARPALDRRGAEAAPSGSPWGGRASPRSGGGFLAGAAQTAVGVAGGMVLGSMLGSMFFGDEAAAADADMGAGEMGGEDASLGDAGADGADFGDFDF